MRLSSTLSALLISLCLFAPLPALAGPASDALGRCLGDSTNGRDRKELARWIFLSISAHPEIRELSSATEATRTDTNRSMAALVTSLLTERCANETRNAIRAEGQAGVANAFKLLGELAMQELMSNPEVAASVGRYAQFLDQKKLESVLK